MSKISYLLRQTSKNSEEAAIYVKHTHQGSPFTRATGVSVAPRHFDVKTGKVSNKVPHAPEWNRAIGQVASFMELAARNLTGKGAEPVKAAMDAEYARILANFEADVKVIPIVKELFASDLERLEAELEDLLLEVAAKREEIDICKICLHGPANWAPALFSGYVSRYLEAQKHELKPRSLRIYEYMGNTVAKWNPTLRMDEITGATLKELQSHLLSLGRRNLTVRDVINKMKNVIYYFAEESGVDVNSIKAFKTVKKLKDPNLRFLNQKELDDLLALSLTKERHQQVRDMYCFMCYTGLRYSDCNVTRANIKKGHVEVTTVKNGKPVKIPLHEKAKEILERNNYEFPVFVSASFNRDLKALCRQVESLQEMETVQTISGGNVKTELKPKWQTLSAHSARKTFVNICLTGGANIANVRGWVGHSDVEMLLGHYASKDANAVEELNRIFG